MSLDFKNYSLLSFMCLDPGYFQMGSADPWRSMKVLHKFQDCTLHAERFYTFLTVFLLILKKLWLNF